MDLSGELLVHLHVCTDTRLHAARLWLAPDAHNTALAGPAAARDHNTHLAL